MNTAGTTHKKAAFRVCGISGRTSNARPQEIGALWQRYFQEGIRERIPDRLNDAILAVYCEYESDHTGEYTLLIGHEVGEDAKVPSGMMVKTIPAATYRVIEARGEQPAAVVEAWRSVWASDLRRAYTADFDLYQSPDTVVLHVGLDGQEHGSSQ